MRLLVKKKAVQGNARKAKKPYQGWLEDRLMNTGENREGKEVKVVVRESSWGLAKKIYQACHPGRLRKTVKEMPYQSFDFKKKKSWRMIIWRTTKKLNQGCPMAKALNAENSDQDAAWRKLDDKKKSGEKVLIKVIHEWYWSGKLTKDAEEVWWRSLFKNVNQEGSDFSWNLRRPV